MRMNGKGGMSSIIYLLISFDLVQQSSSSPPSLPFIPSSFVTDRRRWRPSLTHHSWRIRRERKKFPLPSGGRERESHLLFSRSGDLRLSPSPFSTFPSHSFFPWPCRCPSMRQEVKPAGGRGESFFFLRHVCGRDCKSFASQSLA